MKGLLLKDLYNMKVFSKTLFALVAMMAVFAARGHGIKNVVLTGNLTTIAPIRRVFEGLGPSFGVRFIIPENASFGTVIGAALYDAD